MAASQSGYAPRSHAAVPQFPQAVALDPLTWAEVEHAEALARDFCAGVAFLGTLFAGLAATIRGVGEAPRRMSALHHG